MKGIDEFLKCLVLKAGERFVFRPTVFFNENFEICAVVNCFVGAMRTIFFYGACSFLRNTRLNIFFSICFSLLKYHSL